MVSLLRAVVPTSLLALVAAACASSGGDSTPCEAQVADATAASVPVRLVNNTAGDLYVAVTSYMSCQQTGLFSASVPDPTLSAGPPEGHPCGGWTCATERCSTCLSTNTCSTNPPVTRIAAGGALTTSWAGVVYQKRSVPSACVADPVCWGGSTFGGGSTVTCPVAVANTSWPVAFTATMSTGVSCSGGACAPCTPDATGTCALPQDEPATLSSTTVQGTGTLAEGGTSVDIVFQ